MGFAIFNTSQRSALLFLMMATLLAPSCRCPSLSSSASQEKPPSLSTSQRKPAIHQLQPREALLQVERIKCQQLQDRLTQAGAPRLQIPDPAVLPKISSGEAILSLYDDGSSLQRYLAREHSVTRLTPIALAEINPLAIQARDELEYGSLDPRQLLNSLLERLYSLLLKEVLEEKKQLGATSNLLVLPHGLVRFIPLHALIAAKEQGPSMGASFTFVAQLVQMTYAPCLGLARRRSSLSHAVALAPDYGGHTPASVEEELLSLSQVPVQVSAIRGPQATSASLLRALGQPSTLIHFIGHGLTELSAASSAPPELVFPGELESLLVGQLTARPVQASPVVLACCATAYTARFRDDQHLVPPANLAEALLAAGARSVVAASWNVKDRQSMLQMKDFYGRLFKDGPSAALNHAHRQAIARLQPAHPRFWAFYAAYGAWR